jgi:alkylhydroperoxidase family enzyme
MSWLEPVPPSDAEDQGLKRVLEAGERSGVPDETFIRILAHVPGYAEAIHDAMHIAHVDGNVDHSLKEIIRIQLARTAKDPYFAGLRSTRAIEDCLTEETIDAGSADFESDPRFSDAEKWALRYAYLMYRSPHEIDSGFYDEGKRHFSEAQIMELGGMIAIHYGMQRFMASLR